MQQSSHPRSSAVCPMSLIFVRMVREKAWHGQRGFVCWYGWPRAPMIKYLTHTHLLGTAVGGLVIPLIIPRIIAVHGAALTLRYLSIAIGVTLLPCYPFLKGRLPVARVQGPGVRKPSDRSWLTNRSFWLILAVNTVQGFGYFVPILWLPSQYHCPLFGKIKASTDNLAT
ncbi:hypothetical protein HWV62_99 [Athelia sp. TMB]|nr:hypothetical protein HWV62_43148 [Athelia sp. TMB]KAF7987008.1 hypothetical protein HWV62_99 [Athelia sp. TMB]